MLKTLYDHFAVLYRKILPSNPSLAADHALKQEEEVYKKSTKTTYRNVCIVFPSTSVTQQPHLTGGDPMRSNIKATSHSYFAQ